MSARFFASAYGISVHETGAFSAIFSFTSFSTSRFCCGVSACARKIERQLVRPDVASLLRRICARRFRATPSAKDASPCDAASIARRRGMSTIRSRCSPPTSTHVHWPLAFNLVIEQSHRALLYFETRIRDFGQSSTTNYLPRSPTCPPISA